MNWTREDFEADRVRYTGELNQYLTSGLAEDHVLVERARRRIETVDRVLSDPAYGLAPCKEETYSWWHFQPEQMDAYWIKCTLSGPHDEHKDSNTGLAWKAPAGQWSGALKIKNDR